MNPTSSDLTDLEQEAHLEVLDRTTSAHQALDQVVTGRWMASPDLLYAIGTLVISAAEWAKRAAA